MPLYSDPPEIGFGSVSRDADQLRVLYFTTEYPSVSHTFIRRELTEMERRGICINRVALRPAKYPLCDPLDLDEKEKTFYLLKQSPVFHLFSMLSAVFVSGKRFLPAAFLSLKMALRRRDLFKGVLYFAEACSLLYYSRKQKTNHIHVHFGTNVAAIARLVKRLGGPGYSFTVHGPDEFDAPYFLDLEGKGADAKFVVAISDFCSSQLKRWMRIPDWPKIKVVHCTVGEDFFNAVKPIDKNSSTFVCIGRLAPQKGHLLLLEAFSKLVREQKHEAKLLLIGDGVLRGEIEKRITELGLEQSVTITGNVSEAEVRRHLEASVALVMPSFAEGLPMVFMEAFSIGRPVIGTYVAGIPELVEPRVNGWLVPAGNSGMMCSAMAEVLETESSFLQRMADEGMKRTFDRHNTRTEGDILYRLFLNACGESEPPRRPVGFFGIQRSRMKKAT